jgi:hypothetical protein
MHLGIGAKPTPVAHIVKASASAINFDRRPIGGQPALAIARL